MSDMYSSGPDIRARIPYSASTLQAKGLKQLTDIPLGDAYTLHLTEAGPVLKNGIKAFSLFASDISTRFGIEISGDLDEIASREPGIAVDLSHWKTGRAQVFVYGDNGLYIFATPPEAKLKPREDEKLDNNALYLLVSHFSSSSNTKH